MSQTPDRSPHILAVGAHPDDLEFACGGILLAEAARGGVIRLCVCSRGEAGTNGTPAEREAEARRAAELLRAEIEFIDLGGDTLMEASKQNALTFARMIRTAQPDVLLAPVTSAAQHPDHAAVGRMCEEAARLARYGGVADLRALAPHAVAHHLSYAVTPAAEPASAVKLRVDISAHYARWIELMECHQTQLRTRRYIELQTARARLLGIEAGVDYAQALFLNDDLLVDRLQELPASVRLF